MKNFVHFLSIEHTLWGSVDVSRQYINGACTCAFDNGLIDALKYLFAISTEDVRKEMAYSYIWKFSTKIIDCSYLETDELYIAYFLFYEMTEERQYFMSSYPVFRTKFLLHFSDRVNFLDVMEKNIQYYGKLWYVMVPLLDMLFFNYHLEMDKDDYYRQMFVHIWRRIPSSLKTEIARTDVGGRYVCILIRDNFPFILRKGAFEKIARLKSLDSKPRSSITPFPFNRDKWEFLHFLIEEGLTTISDMKFFKTEMIADLKIRKSNKFAWDRVLRFVQKIARVN